MNKIKNNALWISILAIIIGAGMLFFSNDYEITSKTISIVEGDKVLSKVIYGLSNNKLLFELISTVLLTLGIALFISAFFIRYIEKEERQEFEKTLLSFQKETAKDAIQSVFKRIIEDEFFKIIKKDVLNAKLLRKKANWQYDITIKDGKPRLKRTLSYVLHNISGETVKEPIQISASTTVHSDLKVISGKVRKSNGEETPFDLVSKNDSESETIKSSSFQTFKKEVEVEPDEPIEVVIVIDQTFNNKYIFETHTSRHPVVDLELTVNIPEGYVFDLSSTFSTEPRLRVNESNKKVYVVDGAIYQGQGIEFLCHKPLGKIAIQEL